MSSVEREHFEVLKKLVPDLERLLGERCFALLESGHQFSMEMTWTGAKYKEGYLERLIEHLDSLNGQAATPQRSDVRRRRRTP